MSIITALFAGRCTCGAFFLAGARVRWTKTAGVYVCSACALKTLSRASLTVRGVECTVVVKGRDSVASRVSVQINSAELFDMGALHFDVEGKLAGIGANSALGRGDLAGYVGTAREAAMTALADLEPVNAEDEIDRAAYEAQLR
jgi:hypothetical protein